MARKKKEPHLSAEAVRELREVLYASGRMERPRPPAQPTALGAYWLGFFVAVTLAGVCFVQAVQGYTTTFSADDGRDTLGAGVVMFLIAAVCCLAGVVIAGEPTPAPPTAAADPEPAEVVSVQEAVERVSTRPKPRGLGVHRR